MARLVFFDLDGTITRRDTLLPYVAGFLRASPTRTARLPLLAAPFARFALGGRDPGALKGAVLHALLGGVSRSELDAYTRRFVPQLLAQGLHVEAIPAIEAHRRSGDRLVLMSASVDLYVPAIGRALGFDETSCSEVRWTGDRLDGRLAGANCRGEEKARRFLASSALHPGVETVAYGNSAPDLPHMRLAARAVMVNARGALAREAGALGMECVAWH